MSLALRSRSHRRRTPRYLREKLEEKLLFSCDFRRGTIVPQKGYRFSSVGSFTLDQTDDAVTYIDGSGVMQVAVDNTARIQPNGVLLEPAGENLALRSRDFSVGAVWSVTNITGLKDQTGLDGVVNSASSLLATAGNGTILQTLTEANAEHTFTVDVKRITGTGNIEITDDNGGTWTDIKASLSTTGWYRAEITRTQANPIVGFRIVTSGDKIAVDNAQVEQAAFPSSRIITGAAKVSRVTESAILKYTLPTTASGGALFAETLGAEISSGTLTRGLLYNITADTGGDFYVGSAVGEYFVSDGTETADGNSKVKNVTNAYNSGTGLLPPHATVMAWVRFGFDFDDMPDPTSSGALSVSNSSNSTLKSRLSGGFGRFQSFDATNTADVLLDFAADTLYKLVVQYGYLTSNVLQFRTGIDTGSGISWGTAATYDGSYTIGTDLILAHTPFGPIEIEKVQIYPHILSDAEINALGSP